ncbi:sensor histidine kinase [Brevibacillus dissolubilis]|uniref:sensor histidine kinase n=1 Tax=Brevibacillus dissolubilis TaxID=1844116 RepID=UPI0011179846|nr:ATP-binding protein [Brevibacillus dissolubilis]
MQAILDFILVRIPQANVALFIGMAVFNRSLMYNWKRGVTVSVLFGVAFQVAYLFHIDHESKMLFLFSCVFLLITFLLKEKWGMALLISISTFVLITLMELLLILSFEWMGFTYEQMTQNPVTRYTGMALYLLICLGLGAIMRRYRFDIRRIMPRKKTSGYLSLVILVGGIELFLMCLAWMNNFMQYYLSHEFVMVGGVPLVYWLILIFFLLMMSLFVKHLKVRVHEVEEMSQLFYEKNIRELIKQINLTKDDALRHYRTLDQLLDKKDYEVMGDYVHQLLRDATASQKLLSGIKNPAISALLQAKLTACDTAGISFHLQVRTETQLDFIKTYDVIKVLGNLLDNAIRASQQATDQPYVKLIWQETEQKHSLYIENNGATIPPEKLDRVWDLGYSTKPSGDGGTGLAIVKKVIDQYQGQVDIHSADGITSFHITFPRKKETTQNVGSHAIMT